MAMAEDISTPSGKDTGTENFPVGSILIRPDLRSHVHVYYRWARMADDIVDNPALSPEDKIRRLDLMEEVLLDPTRQDVPVAVAMRESLKATKLDPVNCTDLLIAFRLDATKLRYDDWADLMHYCRYSASPVGRYLLTLHGEAPSSMPPSDALCNALQVINHLQDCALDYREMNRVYVPADHLAAARIDVTALDAPRSSPALRRVLDRLLDETEELMQTARRLPSEVRDLRMRCESAVIVRLADKLIELLRRQDPLARRVKLKKPAIALATLQGIGRAVLQGGPSRKSGMQ
ncbi:MAG: squalene synthase HpnC [Rhodospirillaceae bacterium]|nr:MAG: squalene synthase HpnC [Rhodospirillaceae bacterium]